jgi:hypothetical protein
MVLKHPRRVGNEQVSAFSHVIEGRRLHETGPQVLVDADGKSGSKASHLFVEVTSEVVVVHQDDVRPVPSLPRVGEVPHDSGKRVELLFRVRVALDPSSQPLLEGTPGTPLRNPWLTDELGEAFAVEVGCLVIEGHGHVERVTCHHDVADLGLEREPVQRRVRLDESAMLLGGEGGEDLFVRRYEPVEPGRQLR